MEDVLKQAVAEKYVKRFNDLSRAKEPWNIHFQRLAEVFLTRKQSFTGAVSPGEFLHDEIYDNTGEQAALQAASVYLSMLWPDSTRTYLLRPVDELRGEPGVEAYFRFFTRQVQRYMDIPRAGLLLALFEHYLDKQVFGNSGIGVFEGEDPALPVVYEHWNIKGMCIAENAQGFVDTVYFKEEKTVRQVVEAYGIDAVAKSVREAYEGGRLEDKVEVLKLVEPRPVTERAKEGALAMPYRSVHVDLKNKIVLRESGFRQFPVAIGRAIKTAGEEYGRSPAMAALPDAESLNALKEAVMVASEKQLDPPLGLLDDGRLGGGTVDTSAGALNIFNSSGRQTGEKPVFPLYTVGELSSAEKLMEKFKESIMQAFGLDRLLDLNNQTQMTAYETSVRNRMRGESLGAMFARDIVEVLTPVIERTVTILYDKGYLGVPETGGPLGLIKQAWARILGRKVQIIPSVVLQAIEAGLDFYEVEYVSPAKRFMQSEKLQGIFTATEFVSKLAVIPGMEEIGDNIDLDLTARAAIEYSGAPPEMLRTMDNVKAIRQGRAEAQAAMAKMEQLQQGTEAARNIAQAQATMKGAA